MRLFAWLLLAIILTLVGVVAFTYQMQKQVLASQAPPAPKPLAQGLDATADEWKWAHTEGGRTKVEIRAKSFRQIKEPSLMELEGVDLRLFHKDGKAFDKIESAKAQFDVASGELYSEGEVIITMGLPVSEQAKEHLLRIMSSKVHFDSKQGKADTNELAHFTFDRGEGKATGAFYDPTTRELLMKHDVELHWNSPGKPQMTVQAGELTYKEQESKVYLRPWSKLLRGSLTLNATTSVVTLDKGDIKLVEADQASGTDTLPTKKVEYAAQKLRMNFAENGEVQSVEGEEQARVVSTTPAASTQVTARKVNLQLDAENGSVLQKALANGNAVLEAKPVERPNVPAPETRILRSDIVELFMKPGGELLDKVVTHAPGQLEFLPNRAGQRKRRLDAERMTILYGDQNQLQAFSATNAATRTEAEPKKGQPAPPPALTWSKELSAQFDPQTGQLTRMEQWPDFRYEEGPRHAKSERAVLEQTRDVITLQKSARVWDATGSTEADQIVMDQKSDEMTAEGKVISVRLPEKKPGSTTLAEGESTQARARRMIAKDHHQQIRYEGDAFLWQGSNRVQADQIDIDRQTSRLVANGKVISQFVENRPPADTKASPDAKATVPKPPAQPILTVVKAPSMDYDDKGKLAIYRGGVLLNRPGLEVKSKELTAYLKEEKPGDTTLDKAYADGAVQIFQSAPDRTRTGTSEHGEYYVTDEKVLLQGGQPSLVDSLRGTTRGRQLTYFANDEKLLVDGEVAQPAVSRIKRHVR